MPSTATVTRLSTTAFIAALVVLVALAMVALHEMHRLEQATQWTLHTRDVLSQSDLVLQLITDAETSARGYAISGDSRFLVPHRRALQKLPAASSRLGELVRDNPEEQLRIGTLQPLIESKLAQVGRIINARDTTGSDAAQQLIRSGYGQDVMEQIRTLLAELDAAEQSLLQERLNAGVKSGRATRVALLLLGGIAPLFLVASWVLNRRALARLHHAQALARLGEARLFTTLQSCGDGLIVTDEAGRVTMLNPVAQALTGWREDQARGAPLDEVFRIINEFTRETVESPVSRVLRDGKVVGLANHTVLLARDGTQRPIDDSGAPIKGENGESIGVVLVFRDVTARKLSEQARERLLRAEAEREAPVRANEAKDEFLALVSHELRSPLAAIRGWLHLLTGNLLPQAEVPGALQRIYRNTRLQERLINDLLDVSRITTGKLEVIRGPADLVEIAQAAVDECKSTAEQKDVALHVEKPGSRLFVLGDEHRLVQSLENLVSNGIKFTPAGGSVIVRLERQGEKAVVTVTDTGMGMTPEIRERLFERFWQADSAKTREQGGLGLGLTIAKYLIEEHEGSIRAESPGPERGSTFTIELPVLDPSMAKDRVPAKRSGIGKELIGVRILLVDDDRDLRDATQIFLEARGAVVITAASVHEAIQLYDADPPTAVISDIGMPNEDGYSLADKLRERDAGTKRRVSMIALTGFASAGDRWEALGRGFDAHLAKPVDLEELVARIQTLVRMRKDD